MTAGIRLPRHKGLEVARPPDASDAQWQASMRGLQAFVGAGWAEKAVALGWTRDELFATPPLWSRVDLCGVALLVDDNEVIAVTPDAIKIKTASGSVQAFYRTPEPDFGLVFNERFKLLVGNAGREEGRLRAIEFTVAEYRRAHPGAGLEDAKRAVLVAIAAKGNRP
jgi:hypothetical protein